MYDNPDDDVEFVFPDDCEERSIERESERGVGNAPLGLPLD